MIKKFVSGASAFLALVLSFSAVTARAEIDDKQFEAALTKFIATDKGQQTLGKAVEEYFKKRQELARKEQEDKAAADLESQFKNPVKIDITGNATKGPANAKVTVIEFSDFQCPYCKRGAETMDELLKAYPNDVKLVFKHLPLAFHQQALPASKAAHAAGKQGKFWEMHDALFSNQDKLADGFYRVKAKELGLDLAKFDADFADPATEKFVKDDAAVGAKNGIQGTPGFFVGGVAVKGAYPIDYFKQIVDRHLKGAPAPGK